jgi:hypothetical protein
MSSNPKQLNRYFAYEAADAYIDWREECVAVWDAYQRWANAPPIDAPSAFAAYSAALDLEERAAEIYADLMGRIATCDLPIKPAPVSALPAFH